MASPPPNHKCMICGEALQYKAVERANPQPLMRPTTYEQLPHKCPSGASDTFKRRIGMDWLRDKIAGDPDVECEAGEPLEGRTMTTKITVSVNGDYKIPVKQGETVTWVSGRGNEGPKVVDYWPAHGDAAVFVIGPEEPDNG